MLIIYARFICISFNKARNMQRDFNLKCGKNEFKGDQAVGYFVKNKLRKKKLLVTRTGVLFPCSLLTG